jgi:glucose-6-phosphate 1-dehydrogenase
LVGSGRDDLDDERWRGLVAASFAAGNASGADVDAVAAGTRHVKADVIDESELRRLFEGLAGDVIVYFALPPAIMEKACGIPADIGVPRSTRLVMEKPFRQRRRRDDAHSEGERPE